MEDRDSSQRWWPKDRARSDSLSSMTSKSSYHTRRLRKNMSRQPWSQQTIKDPPAVNATEPDYIVRRLTPTECARLQGFPDWWCSNLGTDEPTEEEIEFWTEVFETHRRVMGASSKPKSRNQIIKWLKDSSLRFCGIQDVGQRRGAAQRLFCAFRHRVLCTVIRRMIRQLFYSKMCGNRLLFQGFRANM